MYSATRGIGHSAFAWARTMSCAALLICCLSHAGSLLAQTLQRQATMADYWSGNAQWALARTWEVGAASGASHLEINDGVWYQFERYITTTNCTRINPQYHHALGTRVRSSTDQGVTWSAPTVVLAPASNTLWACAATDGDAYYDAANNKWRFLFQCLDNTTADWRGCYAERSGSDPMGPFTPVAQNPVINSGFLWNQICNTAQDDCSALAGGPGRVAGEGTFNIFKFDGTYYWVSFHGYDGVRGYRGIAKTTNFVSWVAGNSLLGVPGDSIVDKYDLTMWRELWDAPGAIGVGAGSILEDGGYYYLLTEGADHNLGCTNGQHWDLGLFRSANLSSVSWQQFPQGNPIVYSTRTADYPTGDPPALVIPPCSVDYGQLFRDPQDDAIYMTHYRISGDSAAQMHYLYKLTKTTNTLINGDLWMADSSYWNVFPIGPTNLTVMRDPANASDGNQYIAMNCGTNPVPCQPGQSIYQDVSAAGRKGHWITYGGKFATLDGAGAPTGTLVMAEFQLSSAGILEATSQLVSATSSWTSVASQSVPILADTSTIRYQIYLDSSLATFRADEMYLNISPSVSECSFGTHWDQDSPGIGHSIGRSEADGWSATHGLDSPGFLQYGPYATFLSAGNHFAKWKAMIGGRSIGLDRGKGPVARIEVVDSSAGYAVLASRLLTREDWGREMQYECFALPFALLPAQLGHQLEFRFWWYDKGYVRLQRLGVD